MLVLGFEMMTWEKAFLFLLRLHFFLCSWTMSSCWITARSWVSILNVAVMLTTDMLLVWPQVDHWRLDSLWSCLSTDGGSHQMPCEWQSRYSKHHKRQKMDFGATACWTCILLVNFAQWSERCQLGVVACQSCQNIQPYRSQTDREQSNDFPVRSRC